MSRYRDWMPWDWDVWTIGWVAWMAFFFLWEVASRRWGGKEMLTDHLRPVFLSEPLVWFIAFGLWLWIGVHLLVPTLESWIVRAARG